MRRRIVRWGRTGQGVDSARVALPRNAVKLLEHNLGARDYRRRGTALGGLAVRLTLRQ